MERSFWHEECESSFPPEHLPVPYAKRFRQFSGVTMEGVYDKVAGRTTKFNSSE